jgi:iron complex transport system substrate-binding protein
MKKVLVLTLLLMVTFIYGNGIAPQESVTNAQKKTTLVDMAGRTLEIPEQVDTLLAKSPIGTIITYTLSPSYIAGQNWSPTEAEKEYLDKIYLQLPMLSGWHAGNEGNLEAIIQAGPSVLISASFNPEKDQASREFAEKLEMQIGIPVVIFDARLQSLPQTYRFFGKLLDCEERAEELALYAESVLEEIGNKVATLSNEERVSVYYAEGTEGLQTDPSGSFHTQVIDYLEAINVAQVDMKGGLGRSQVSPEQLAIWNPDVIICCHDQGFSQISGTYMAVKEDPRFAVLDAVKEGQVYEVPYKPFNFMDRPPSINRLIGLKWLASTLYPDMFTYEIEEEIREFYDVFYSIELSDEQMDDILCYSRFQKDK